jgi:redox-sensitive bicupin YhaK (pirin superfamily)
MVGPFVFFDHMGPLDLPAGIPASTDVRPHPHIGLETITYLFSGEIMHRDSVGVEQAIRAGEVNWMTAGRGITHSERFERARAMGDHLHGIQAWVALPSELEETAPAFAHYDAGELPNWNDNGAHFRLIAGEAFGESAHVKTHSPLFYLHVELAAGAWAPMPDGYAERAAYIAAGRVDVGGQTFAAGQMIVFRAGSAPALKALEPATLMLIGGETLGPRYLEWNFVSSSLERIAQAKSDWRAGRMKLPDLDDGEFIPLPGG